ncbi:hypothetical protein HGH93_08490 [Chitinophaga polysaccharea]|uniref:hypothetical protein n=1 Tax=Chitinophaga TaxID=79328 RepID=UPI0014559430|nr:MULTISPECIES: hypothetical protein [Chitinophaga]NLR58133.1 hypothetical protein [Chitinophaga polysaccharea]NLU90672.1 hypothetical protein [Chitinophaga sp. Ak27]
MSFDIQLFSAQTREREQQSGNDSFFDNPDNLSPFTEEQFQGLKERLQQYEYVINTAGKDQVELAHPDYNIRVLLTRNGVYFTAGWDQESIFEAGMTASEFTDSGEFWKYDPQNGGWEEIA